MFMNTKHSLYDKKMIFIQNSIYIKYHVYI